MRMAVTLGKHNTAYNLVNVNDPTYLVLVPVPGTLATRK